MNKALRDSLDVAHIIKMSDEHVTLAQADEFVHNNPHKLFIQSMGAKGHILNDPKYAHIAQAVRKRIESL